MSYLHEKHDAVLAYSLESPNYFGGPVTFTSPETVPTYAYTLNGKISVNMDDHKQDGKSAVAKYARVVMRYSSMAIKAGKDIPDPAWESKMPVAGWTVTFTNEKTGKVEVYILENGSITINWELGVIHYVLAEMDVVA